MSGVPIVAVFVELQALAEKHPSMGLAAAMKHAQALAKGEAPGPILSPEMVGQPMAFGEWAGQQSSIIAALTGGPIYAIKELRSLASEELGLSVGLVDAKNAILALQDSLKKDKPKPYVGDNPAIQAAKEAVALWESKKEAAKANKPLTKADVEAGWSTWADQTAMEPEHYPTNGPEYAVVKDPVALAKWAEKNAPSVMEYVNGPKATQPHAKIKGVKELRGVSMAGLYEAKQAFEILLGNHH